MENKIVKSTIKQASYWAYAAWTTPFIAMILLVGEILIGHDSMYGVMAISIVVTFVTTSVLWWWWALRRILYMIKTTQQVEQNFESLMAEISSLKKDMDTKVRPKNK